MSHVDEQLLVFRRQYLQLLEPDFLSWPPKPLLQDAGAQQWMYRNLFSVEHNKYIPSDRYQFRVLKDLINRIEQAIEDPDEHEVCEDLMSQFSSLVSSSMPSELVAVQQRSYVTYSRARREESDETITILERRNLISGSLTTGFRTWEAALHLATYLWTELGRGMIKGKDVIELGAGTGLLSLLCAKHLGAGSVMATDGDQAVVEALTENASLNGSDPSTNFKSRILKWGHALGSLEDEAGKAAPRFDVVLGADIIYDKTAVPPLVATLSMLFQTNPQTKVLIANAVRNIDTFSTFLEACGRHGFTTIEIEFAVKPMRQQSGIFYATAMPLKLLQIEPTTAS